jgi:ubiquinone/menaquinone biosynthesis C-methylase UbiE
MTATQPRRGSYDARRENAGLAAELARLDAQCALGWEAEARRLGQLGLRDGQRVLEVGSGPGSFTERLAARLPTSEIVALDPDVELLAVARRRLAGVGGRVSFLAGSAASTGLADASVDVAISRYVFQHLADPVGAAAEVRRVLRPGGFHVVVDIDDGLWGLSEPAFPELRSIYARAGEAQRRRGGDRLVGRRLGRILEDAGYTNVGLDLFCYDSHSLGLGPFLPQLSPDRLLPLLGEGAIDAKDLGVVCGLLDRFLAAPSPFVLMVGFVAYGERPSS